MSQKIKPMNEIAFYSCPELGGLQGARHKVRNWEYPPHVHEEFCLIHVSTGTLEAKVRGTNYRAGQGDIVVFNPDWGHEGRIYGEETTKFEAIYPKYNLLARYLFPDNKFERGYFPEPVISDPKTSKLFKSAMDCIEKGFTSFEKECAFFEGLDPLFSKYFSESKKDLPYRESAKVEKALEIFNEKYLEQINIYEVAKQVGLTVNYFIRVFKKEKGLSPYSYLISKRVNSAKKLLQTDFPLAEVSLMAGFYDQSHLTRHFKRMVGLSPGDYRKKILPVQ